MFEKDKLLLLIFFLFGCTLTASAQNKAITGTVTDAQTGKSLPGVNILVVGTSTGAATDGKGHYRISVPSLQDSLRFSFIGYKQQTILINGRTTINIQLKPTVIAAGNQLVVVGFGKQKKKDLTGSVTSLSTDSLASGVVTSVAGILNNGNMPGVEIVRNSAAPGGGVSINVRGASSINAGTSPLYVIDGLPITSNPVITGAGVHFPGSRTKGNILSSINPNDIKSISVLKGPSATAIYGARGSNGVVLITTKEGREGHTQVAYSGYAGIQNVANRLNVLNAQQYKSILNSIIDAGGGDPSQKITTIANNGRGTNWQKAIFNNNAIVQNHDLSFSGGGSSSTYRISLNYLNQNGVVKNNELTRYSGRINLTSQLSDKFTVGLNLSTTFNHNLQPPIQSFGVNEDNGTLYDAYNADPTVPIKDENGNYVPLAEEIAINNPVAMVNGESQLFRTYRTFGTIYGKYNILPQLSVKLDIGANVLNQDKNVYINHQTLNGRAENGIATIFHGKQSNYLLQATINYEKSFENQNIKILGGIESQKYDQYNINMSANDFPSDEIRTFNIGLGDPSNFGVYSHKESHKLISYIARANYSLLNKYIITATMRIDGSSRFGPNSKYGYFPSAALGWRINEEQFLKNFKPLSELKLRVGWGQTGNDEIGNYAYISTFASGDKAIMDGKLVSTTEPSRLANPGLKWETSQAVNVGLDFGFINNRLNGSLDFYHKKTFNMLVQLPVPTSSGFSTQLSNVGKMVNRGFELALNSRNVSTRGFRWQSKISFTTIENEVKSLGSVGTIINGGAGFSGNVFITKPGEPLNSYYGYKIIGVWQKNDDFSKIKDAVRPGDLKYMDVNGDSTINAQDRVILGNSFPNFTWSFGNTFDYKNFELNIRFKGVQGVSMLNANLIDTYFPIDLRRNKFAKPLLNRWTPQHPSNKYPSFVHLLDEGNKAVNSYTVEDASYLRLQLVRLSYTMRFSKLISTATIYVTGQNLFTITPYDGVDPSVNPNGSANRRIDYDAYPLSRTFLLGVNIKF
jgi:TonB-linked SusC/RagA family outer membrane protein